MCRKPCIAASGDSKMSDESAEPLVALVGAGPGNPGLLTVRAVECLARADLVLYDYLVPVQLLDYAPEQARRVCVNELAPHHPERIPHIHRLMIDAARQGLCVVRLKGGDPLLFGRGGEEAEALREAGIAYEIVPGVTAALGAAAYVGIPLTHRLHSSAVAIVTGHEKPDKPQPNVNWAALAQFPGTIVVYMGLSRLPWIAQTLISHGLDPLTPAVAIHAATTGGQRTVAASLRDLPDAVKRAELTAPAVIVIGSVVSLRSELAWFEKRPLFGKRVLVTRPRHQAADMARRLEILGAEVVLLPAVEVREPSDWSAADHALLQLASYQWLVFTSANGVHAFMRRLRHLGRDLRALGPLRLAAIGPATADALGGYHLVADLMPGEFRSESLAAVLKERAKGQRILLARADRGRELLREELATVAEVEQIAVYSQMDAVDGNLAEVLRQGHIDYITLTSSNIARALLGKCDEPTRSFIKNGAVQLVSISPVTSAAVRELGYVVSAEATKYTMDGVLAALVELAGRASDGTRGPSLARAANH
jgi:uroporphyrinogen III methyltransferase/synthase